MQFYAWVKQTAFFSCYHRQFCLNDLPEYINNSEIYVFNLVNKLIGVIKWEFVNCCSTEEFLVSVGGKSWNIESLLMSVLTWAVNYSENVILALTYKKKQTRPHTLTLLLQTFTCSCCLYLLSIDSYTNSHNFNYYYFIVSTMDIALLFNAASTFG